MPTYQYACTACDHELEVVQSFSDDPLTVCPVCEGRLRKRFGSVGIVFKGSGFYRTDSRAGANGSNGSESSKSSDSKDAETKSSETKSSENSESKSSSTEKKPATATASSS